VEYVTTTERDQNGSLFSPTAFRTRDGRSQEKGESVRFAYDMYASRGVQESTLQKSLSLDAFSR